MIRGPVSILPFICVNWVCSEDLSLCLCQKSTYHERYPPPPLFLSQLPPFFYYYYFLFSLCGVEGIGVLPQVAGTTDAADTLDVRRTMQREARYCR